MDWANEWWVRLYTRDTTTWKLLAWEARSVLMHMLRKVDRAGVLEVGDDGVLGLAAILDMPEDVVATHLPALLKRGAVELVGTAYILPKFLDAQETPSSDRQRQRVSRENRRDRARGDSVTKSDRPSRNVTECHAPSRGVTNGHSEREEREDLSIPPVTGGGEGSGFALSSPAEKPAKVRGARSIPSDWTPDGAHAEEARRLELNLDDQANRMRDWAISKDVRRVDWAAVFRNWLRTAHDRAPVQRTVAVRPQEYTP